MPDKFNELASFLDSQLDKLHVLANKPQDVNFEDVTDKPAPDKLKQVISFLDETLIGLTLNKTDETILEDFKGMRKIIDAYPELVNQEDTIEDNFNYLSNAYARNKCWITEKDFADWENSPQNEESPNFGNYADPRFFSYNKRQF